MAPHYSRWTTEPSVWIVLIASILSGCANLPDLADRVSDEKTLAAGETLPTWKRFCHGTNGREFRCGNRPRIGEVRAAAVGRYLESYFGHEPWFTAARKRSGERGSHRPRIGLAMSGGGTKASPFGFGAIKHLVDRDWLDEIDLVSSVSGGGYSAFFLYTRAAHIQDLISKSAGYPIDSPSFTASDPSLASILEERIGPKCASNPLRCYFRDYRTTAQPLNLNGKVWDVRWDPKQFLWWRKKNPCPEFGCVYVPSDDLKKIGAEREYHLPNENISKTDSTFELMIGPDCYKLHSEHDALVKDMPLRPDRSVTWSRCHPDILNYFGGGHSIDVGVFDIENISKDYGWLPISVILHGISLPAHYFANWIFDWRINLAPTFFQQRDGIYRSYGSVPDKDWLGPFDPEHRDDNLPRDALRPWGISFDKPVINFGQLRALSQLPPSHPARVPMWILNASAPSGPSFDFSTVDLERMDMWRFEMSPFGFGSHEYGFSSTAPDVVGFSPQDALAASHGFKDSRQRIFDPVKNAVATAAIELANLHWSVTMPNYSMSKAHRILWRSLPLLHFANRLDERRMRPGIQLGDGGIIRDNLGLLPLLARGTRHILVFDQSSDSIGKTDAKIADQGYQPIGMQNLCEVNRFLLHQGATMVFKPPQGGQDSRYTFSLAKQCDNADHEPKLLTPLNARAWVTPVWEGEIRACRPDETNGNDLCKNQNSPALLLGTKIYHLKPALDHDSLTRCWAKIQREAIDLQRSNEDSVAKAAAAPDKPPLPETLCAWYGNSLALDANRDNLSGARFPQHSVIDLTINNAPDVMMAYFDLGNYAARHLGSVLFDRTDLD